MSKTVVEKSYLARFVKVRIISEYRSAIDLRKLFA